MEFFCNELYVTPELFSSVVSLVWMYGNISRYWWIYIRSRILMWGISFSFAVYVGVCGCLWIEEYCVRDFISDFSVGFFLGISV